MVAVNESLYINSGCGYKVAPSGTSSKAVSSPNSSSQKVTPTWR